MKKAVKKSVLALVVALCVSQVSMAALAYDEARLDTDTTFSSGASHVMYIKNDGTVVGAGYTYHAALGFVNKTAYESHQTLLDYQTVTDVSLGYWHSFYIKPDNTLWAMGHNEYAQLGNGQTAGERDATYPVQILSDVAAVTTNNYNAIALKTDGTLWRWGRVYKDDSGDRTTVMTPEKVMDDVVSVSGGMDWLIAIKSDGSVWTMGRNVGGVLGISGMDLPDDFVTENTPVKIMEDGVSVVGGSDHALVLKSDGSVWAWGDGDDGQLGNGLNESNGTPTKVMDDVKVIAAGYDSSFAITNDGTLYGWGDNEYGQMGNGTLEDVLEPMQIATNVVDVNGNVRSTYFLKADGTLWGCGDAEGNVFNNGQTSGEQTTPVQIASDVKIPTTVAVTPPTPEPTPPASDEPSDWAAEDVEEAEAIGIVPESLQGLYTQATTRAEFCALAVDLMETATGAPITERAEFSDTDDVNVQKMAGIGVVNGIGDGKFDPNGGLTREQAATILARLAAVMSMELTKSTATFSDNGDVSDWAFEAVGQMQASGIMGGVGENMFAPDGPYTREQSILTTLRVFNLYIG